MEREPTKKEVWKEGAALLMFPFVVVGGFLVVFFRLVLLVLAIPHETLNPRPDERYKKLDSVDPCRQGVDFRQIVKQVLLDYASDSGGSIPKSKFDDVTRGILEGIVSEGVSFLNTSTYPYYYGWWVFIPAEQVPSIVEPIDWDEYEKVYGGIPFASYRQRQAFFSQGTGKGTRKGKGETASKKR